MKRRTLPHLPKKGTVYCS